MNNNSYHTIRKWMYRNARPIDLARYRYHFEEGCKDSVLNCLGVYQNEDGGFGHALEADSWNPNSSPIQTWTATEILKELDITDSSHKIIQGILSYLSSGKDFVSNRWLNTIKSNNDYPGAPWWHFKEDEPHNLRFNPTASLAGFALKYADRESQLFQLAKEIAVESVEYFIQTKVLDEMHEIYCFVNLMEYIIEADLMALVDFKSYQDKIKDVVLELIENDFSKWQGNYVCKPSQFFNGSDSEFYEANKEAVSFELEFIQNTINSKGVWEIPWSWGSYETEFAISKNWWMGNLVIKNLLLLKHYDFLLKK
ncbi:MAG: hypothetical protein JEZ08_04390 [Clostridiales bacterium]|nr:hypothetical protein [Clostridiales bacterium]